ncbi:hypothetical protein BpHYR1_017248 [Brachionus plicatilis]|uniref:Uncharacterized protein n=1 Tax=Brachionus plicatilis TaxID=10195 RepID=A0A3M7SQ07_BRAPC|nr:hypothetical protein BpHYR1_017248 [Brachionus plicatilis]
MRAGFELNKLLPRMACIWSIGCRRLILVDRTLLIFFFGLVYGRRGRRRVVGRRLIGRPAHSVRRARPGLSVERLLFDLELAGRLDAPKRSFAGLVLLPGHLDKVSVQRQVVSDRVLPALVVQLVIAVIAGYKLVDLAQCELLFF